MTAAKQMLDRILYWITVVLFALLVIEVVWQVGSRQVLGNPSTWTEEGARLTFVWLGLFAAALVFGERGHIAVEYVARKLPSPAQRGLAVFVHLCVVAFALGVLVWGGWQAVINAWGQGLSSLPFTFGHMYLALPVSGVLTALYGLYFILGTGSGGLPPYPEIVEEPELQMEKYTDETIVGEDGGPHPSAHDEGTGEEGA